MMRRDFLRRMLYGGTVLAASGATRNALHSASTDNASPSRQTPAALPFALEDITILDPDLLRMRQQTLDYMLPGLAKTSALHLRKRIRTLRRRQLLLRCPRGPRSCLPLPPLADVRP